MKQLFVTFAAGLTLLSALNSKVEKPKEHEFVVVKVTMYSTDPKQTDSSPYITASGFHLNRRNPKKHRIIAVSRDLKQKLNFGDTVKLEGTNGWDGDYIVHDLMNKRFKNRIDILINPKDEATMFAQAKLILP